ncbi:MAG TPA: hypothetical protein VJP86_07735 [Vicinamibacterales bacterium]|nr:hypothetical protein [Vicinamibacterales bacterium]
MKTSPCVISVADHAGWAYALCVAAPSGIPAVVERRRLTLIDAGLPTMPYHHESLGLPVDEADRLIARVRQSIASCALLALKQVAVELAPTHVPVALAIREPTFPVLPETVAGVRASYQLQCAADGMMYQFALCQAARDLDLDVEQCRRGDESARAAAQLGVHLSAVEAFVSGVGRPPGPPWTEEHRRAYAAGIAALSRHQANVVLGSRVVRAAYRTDLR